MQQELLLARGGGGGSGGGGGGGGGGGSGSGGLFGFVIWFVILIIVGILSWRAYKQVLARDKREREEMHRFSEKDPSWKPAEIITRIPEVFFGFQKTWSENHDLAPLDDLLTTSYRDRARLELAVLKQEKRKNLMEDVQLLDIKFMSTTDDPDDSKDQFTARITAKARDILFDIEEQKNLFVDAEAFMEFWTFKKEQGMWKLDLIRQATENAIVLNSRVAQFAEENKFYYDPDFGWLMLPNKGVLFGKSQFGTSDVNNHVIGMFRNTIVEFYTYVPTKNSRSYVVAQAILPKSYKNILIKRKGLFNFNPSGLHRIQLEGTEFNRKFCVWADREDRVNSLELLAPDFMAKIYDLPFELNIEIVGNFLYFYAKERADIDFHTMLKILTWAFDEMKM